LKVNDENSRIRIQDPDPLVRGMDPRIRIHPKMSWIRNTATHLVSAAPGSADTYIPVGTGTYSPHHCAWICRYLHICRYPYLLTSSVQRLDLQIPTYLYVPVPSHLVSAASGSADTYIPVGTCTYSPRQCSAWIRSYLSYLPLGTGTYSHRQCRAWIRRYLHTCRYW
jgi:hypothetical protein